MNADVAVHIMCFLTFSDVLHVCCLVNRDWYKYSTQEPYLWTVFTELMWGRDVAQEKLSTMLSQSESNVTRSGLEAFKYLYTRCCYQCCVGVLPHATTSTEQDNEEQPDFTVFSRGSVPINMCSLCNSPNHVITRTNAKKMYKLNDADLGSLPIIMKWNNTHRVDMTLIPMKMLQHKADSKHFSVGGLEKKKERTAAAAEKRRNTLERKRRERTAELEEALNARGLELRSDSELCDDYIEGKNVYSLERIVDIMEEMKFYHEQTDYPELYREIRSEYYDSYYQVDHIEVSQTAKYSALRDWIRSCARQGQPLEELLAASPRSLHEQIRALFRPKKEKRKKNQERCEEEAEEAEAGKGSNFCSRS